MLPETWQELLDGLTYESQKTDNWTKISRVKCQDIIRTCLNDKEVRHGLLQWITYKIRNAQWSKSALKASKFRVQGNEKFRKLDNARSMSLYTESVIHAPRDSEELSLALANRSAVLFHLEAYQDCLRDIELAFKNDYPSPLHYKLHTRRGHCFSRLGKYKDALEALQVAQECLGDMSQNKKTSVHQDIKAALTKVSSQLMVDNSNSEQPKTLHIPQLTHGEHNTFVHASAALDLGYSEEKGRHVITNRTVKMGDILLVEKPYAFVVLPDQYSAHCHNCCALYTAPVPCWECTMCLYCSETCRQDSWDRYHRWECHGGLELLHCVGIAHLGLRVVLTAGPLSKLQDRYTMLQESMQQEREAYDNYMTVYQLVTHLENIAQEDLFQYATTACMLTLYLSQCTDYFKSEPNEESALCLVGGLVLRHVVQLVCNAHAITKLHRLPPEREGQRVVVETQVRVAAAIYPSASMMNHSCDPSVINSFYNQYLIVRACRDMPKGEEVFNCYGPHFRHMGLQQRQEVLRTQYFFSCSCRPCSLPAEQDFQCSKCSGPLLRSGESAHKTTCGDCGHKQGSGTLVETALKARALFQEACATSNMKEALSKLKKCQQLQQRSLYRSHQDLSACVDQMAKCHATLGDYGSSVECLQQCLPAVEEQFGIHSVEVANELQKLSDVMLCDLGEQIPGAATYLEKHRKATECVQRAKQILELHYGMWNAGLQDILCKEQQLERTVQQ